MSTTNHRISDFVSLFNAFWYRDFPLSEVYKSLSNRAGWTAHIGSVVKSSAVALAQSEINISVGAKAPKLYFQDLLKQCNGGKKKYGGITDMDELKEKIFE